MNRTKGFSSWLFLGCVLATLFSHIGCELSEIPGSAPTPITGDLFPLVTGRQFEYTGYAIGTTGNILPDPGGVFRTVWSVDSAGPFAGSTLVVDTTTLFISGIGPVTRVDSLTIRKDTTSGDFEFLRSLGVFFRTYRIAPAGRTDTMRWIAVARKSAGLTGAWTAFDSTYTDTLGARVRLRINGAVEARENITDSSTSHLTWDTYRVRTSANISVNDSTVVSNATMVRLWLAPGVGPIQTHLAQDSENVGFFRVLRSKNF